MSFLVNILNVYIKSPLILLPSRKYRSGASLFSYGSFLKLLTSLVALSGLSLSKQFISFMQNEESRAFHLERDHCEKMHVSVSMKHVFVTLLYSCHHCFGQYENVNEIFIPNGKCGRMHSHHFWCRLKLTSVKPLPWILKRYSYKYVQSLSLCKYF